MKIPRKSFIGGACLAAAALGSLAPAQAMEILSEKFAEFTKSEASPAPARTPAVEPPAASSPSPTPVPATAQRPPVVRVNVTQQSYSFTQPWRKNQTSQRQGLGVVLPDGRILVTAGLVADHTYIELEEPETARKEKAELAAIDYETNLALLSAPAAGFLQNIAGAKLDESAVAGSRVDLVQLEPNGTPVRTPATLTTVEVGPYALEDSAFLLYRLSVPLQTRENSFTLPAFKDGALVGLVMRYDPRTQTADLVPSPVIARFLQAACKEPYAGFPKAGLTFSDTRDPQLRRYAKLNNGTGGAYITKVLAGSPAEAAGLKVGDILLRIGDKTIDQDGNYEDARFGKVSLAHHVSTVLASGDKVPLVVWRDGAEKTVDITLAPRDIDAMISAPYVFDSAPKYLIVGGVVFTELSRQFLREWGPSWTRDAPVRLLYFDRFQSELPADRGKIVFISGVLPGPNTMGYEDLAFEVVESANGRPVRGLEDLAAAVDSPTDKFLRIKLAEDPGLVILDLDASKADENRIREQYRIPKIRNLGTEK